MKIKLIHPRMSLRPMDTDLKRLMSPSLALLTLASLTPSEHEVSIEDENICEINFDDSPDLVGITVNVDTALRSYEIASIFRSKNIKVILGGIHVSANTEEALKYSDSVCIGEAEEIWNEILEDLKKGALKKKYFNAEPSNLATVPIIDWNSFDTSKYLYNNTVVTSRGCPYLCEFCYNSSDYVHHSFRNRPISDVVKEIQSFKTRHVMFIDDNFIGNISWTRSFLKAIKPLNLKWNAAVSANIALHLDLLDEMKASGCQSLFIGLESINKASIESVNKLQNYKVDYDNLIKEIHSRGIMINASLVFGLDHDDKNTFKNTLDWLVKNKIETMTAHILTPYPGTALFKRFETERRITDYNWNNYNTSKVVYKPKNMSAEELYEGYMWMYREFYSIKNIFKRIPADKGQVLPYLLFCFIYRKFGKITSMAAKFGLLSNLGRLARRLAYGIE